MDRILFDCSIKNIPCSHQGSYLRRLIEQTEKLIKNMRWRAFFFLHLKIKASKENGFNSTTQPPPVEKMHVFENRMTDLIQNIEFHKNTNEFQCQLKKD